MLLFIFLENLYETPCSELQVGNSILNSVCVTTLPQDTLRHRPPNVLPTFGNSAQDMDNLDDVKFSSYYIN